MTRNLSTKPCAHCGEENYSLSYMDSCAEKKRMVADGFCFMCAFWAIQSEQNHKTVIDGRIYTPGTGSGGRFAGMAGRRFDIEYFDGTKITTHDLWAGGCVPDEYREQIPDTARFVGGASEHVVDGIHCWNESTEEQL